MLERLRSQLASARERVGAAVDYVRHGATLPLPVVQYDTLSNFDGVGRMHDGSKFPGGFGITELLTADHWKLRARSTQLFETNLYARGLIRRLVTNEIAVGLHLEATPRERILGAAPDSLSEWAEDVEERFELWQSDPWLCDHLEQSTFGALQIAIRMEALIAGDVLIVLRQFSPTQLPRLQVISGAAVRDPSFFSGSPVKLAKGHQIRHGVELDAMGRQVGYWVTQSDGTSKRIPANGEKSGRKIAWLVYGSDKRLDEVRGKPILSLVLQSMREIDRYRDSTQRKAVINSMLAMFVQRDAEKSVATRPIMGGAIKKGTVIAASTEPDAPRRFNVAELIPGLVIDELGVGEKPVAFPSNGTDEKFGDFERAIIQAIAWANEIPPEILMLSFSSNYSASAAALNEFKMYLNKTRTTFGDTVCTPVYNEWLLAMTLNGKITASGLLEAWRDPKSFDLFGAWVSCDWTGNIKPSVDPVKQATANEKLIAMGLTTRDRAARETNGSKYSSNVKKLRLENEALVRANEPLTALDPKFLPPPDSDNAGDDDEPSDSKDASAAPSTSLRVVS